MDFGFLFRNGMISVQIELEQAGFRVLIPGIPFPEKSQKECGLRLHTLAKTDNVTR